MRMSLLSTAVLGSTDILQWMFRPCIDLSLACEPCYLAENKTQSGAHTSASKSVEAQEAVPQQIPKGVLCVSPGGGDLKGDSSNLVPLEGHHELPQDKVTTRTRPSDFAQSETFGTAPSNSQLSKLTFKWYYAGKTSNWFSLLPHDWGIELIHSEEIVRWTPLEISFVWTFKLLLDSTSRAAK